MESLNKPQIDKNNKILTVDEQHKILVGVAAGIANYFGIHSISVRILFVVSAITTGGIGYFVYILFAIFMPDDPVESAKRADTFKTQQEAAFSENEQTKFSNGNL